MVQRSGTKSAIMNIFRQKKISLFKSFVKIELHVSYAFKINLFNTCTAENCMENDFSDKSRCFSLVDILSIPIQLKTAWKNDLSDKSRCFSLVGYYGQPFKNSRQLFFRINVVVLIVIIC